MRRTIFLIALIAAVAACSDDGGSSGAAIDDDAGAMTQALSLVPDTGANSDFVLVNDYAGAGEVLGLDRPEPTDDIDEDDVADWFIPLTLGREDTVGGLQNNGFLGTRVVEDEAWRDEVGWAPIDVDLAVEVGPNDDSTGYYAFRGTFDPDKVEDAVTDDDNPWADELETEEHAGVSYYSWGPDDEVNADRITVVRPLGRGGRMAVLDDSTILWAWQTEALEVGIDAATGEADSLADNGELGPLAEAMDDAGAHGAAFSTDEEIFEGADPGDVDPLQPYAAYATGVEATEDEPEVLIALVHDDDEAAEDNVDRLEEIIEEGESAQTAQAWSDQFDIVEIESDGPTLTARLEAEDGRAAGIWVQIVFTRDSLLAT